MYKKLFIVLLLLFLSLSSTCFPAYQRITKTYDYYVDAAGNGDFTLLSAAYDYCKLGGSTSQFDITNPSGTTFRYTWDGTGTDPILSKLSVGKFVYIAAQNFNSANNGFFAVTGTGTNYFEVTNTSGVAENDKTLGTGYLHIAAKFAVAEGVYTETASIIPTSYSNTDNLGYVIFTLNGYYLYNLYPYVKMGDFTLQGTGDASYHILLYDSGIGLNFGTFTFVSTATSVGSGGYTRIVWFCGNYTKGRCIAANVSANMGANEYSCFHASTGIGQTLEFNLDTMTNLGGTSETRGVFLYATTNSTYIVNVRNVTTTTGNGGYGVAIFSCNRTTVIGTSTGCDNNNCVVSSSSVNIAALNVTN